MSTCHCRKQTKLPTSYNQHSKLSLTTPTNAVLQPSNPKQTKTKTPRSTTNNALLPLPPPKPPHHNPRARLDLRPPPLSQRYLSRLPWRRRHNNPHPHAPRSHPTQPPAPPRSPSPLLHQQHFRPLPAARVRQIHRDEKGQADGDFQTQLRRRRHCVVVRDIA